MRFYKVAGSSPKGRGKGAIVKEGCFFAPKNTKSPPKSRTST